MNALTRSEVESWPELGPSTIEKQRVLDLINRAEKAELDFTGLAENLDLGSLNRALDDARARVAELESAVSLADFARREAMTQMINMAREAAHFDLVAHLHRQRAFSAQTFGPGARAKGVCDHIRKELKEIELDPTDLKEWVDVVLLALDGAWRAGWTPKEIADAIEAKQTKNEGRQWPDWRKADPDKAIEHERTGEKRDEVTAAKERRWVRQLGEVIGETLRAELPEAELRDAHAAFSAELLGALFKARHPVAHAGSPTLAELSGAPEVTS